MSWASLIICLLFTYQIHLDEVVVLPSCMINYATSESCQVECCVSNDERFFTLQGHPEFTEEFLAILSKEKNVEEYFERIDESLKGEDYLMRFACFNFLHMSD